MINKKNTKKQKNQLELMKMTRLVERGKKSLHHQTMGLEDILNPIPIDINLSGKYPDTPVNIDELASVEVLPEFKKPGNN